MKISKKVMIVCMLVGGQATCLLGKVGGAGSSTLARQAGLASSAADVAQVKNFLDTPSATRTQLDFQKAKEAAVRLNNLPAASKTAEIKYLLGRVQPLVVSGPGQAPRLPERIAPALPPRPGQESGVPVATGGPAILQPTMNMISRYFNKPVAERTERDFEMAQMAYQSLNKYLAPTFGQGESAILAKNAFNNAVQRMVDSNWNLITKRPILKNKYEGEVIAAGSNYLKMNKNNFNLMVNILNKDLSSRITDQAARNSYVNELMGKITRGQADVDLADIAAMPIRPAAMPQVENNDLQLENISGLGQADEAMGQADWAGMRQTNRDKLIAQGQADAAKMKAVDWEGIPRLRYNEGEKIWQGLAEDEFPELQVSPVTGALSVEEEDALADFSSQLRSLDASNYLVWKNNALSISKKIYNTYPNLFQSIMKVISTELREMRVAHNLNIQRELNSFEQNLKSLL